MMDIIEGSIIKECVAARLTMSASRFGREDGDELGEGSPLVEEALRARYEGRGAQILQRSSREGVEDSHSESDPTSGFQPPQRTLHHEHLDACAGI